MSNLDQIARPEALPCNDADAYGRCGCGQPIAESCEGLADGSVICMACGVTVSGPNPEAEVTPCRCGSHSKFKQKNA